MVNGEVFTRIEEMLQHEEMTVKQGVRLLMGSILEIHKKIKCIEEWQDSTDKRLDKLESKDTRYVATIAAISSILGAALAVVGVLLAT